MKDTIGAKEPNEGFQFVEFGAPEVIEQGTNFYNQPPYSTTFESIFEQTGVPVDSLARFISKCCSSRREGDIEQGVMHEIEKSLIYSQSKASIPLPEVARNDRVKLKLTIYNAFQILNENYPYWAEYIFAKKHQSFFDFAGEFHESTRNDGTPIHYTPIPSYASWVTDRLKREGKLKYYGLDEILPQSPSTSNQLTQGIKDSGHHTGWRRWRIPATHNLLPERR